MSEQQGGFSDSLSEWVKSAIQHQMTEVHMCMPGKIESYNSGDNTATVKPTISRRMRGAAEPVEYPVIPKVPVVQPRTAKARINFPIEPGDLVLLVFADRNIENWLQSRGDEPKETRDLRQHDLSDVFAIVGGYPLEVPAPPKFPGALNIEVEPGTKVAVTNGTVELLDLFDQIMEKLDAVLINVQAMTMLGVTSGGGVSGVPVNAAAFALDQTAIALIKTKLSDLKA